MWSARLTTLSVVELRSYDRFVSTVVVLELGMWRATDLLSTIGIQASIILRIVLGGGAQKSATLLAFHAGFSHCILKDWDEQAFQRAIPWCSFLSSSEIHGWMCIWAYFFLLIESSQCWYTNKQLLIR